MSEVQDWSYVARAERACQALIKKEFDAVVARTATEAADLVMRYIKPGFSVGFGGSMTVRSLGIQEKATAAGATLLDHNAPGLTPEAKRRILRGELTCDVFISSVNALTLDGALLNVDGTGNRIAALTFGPAKTIVVVGANKIVADEEEGWARIRAAAAPMNCKRLGRTTPCVKTGQCMDCDSPQRICRIYQVLRRKPSLSDFTVILVDENLGY